MEYLSSYLILGPSPSLKVKSMVFAQGIHRESTGVGHSVGVGIPLEGEAEAAGAQRADGFLPLSSPHL